MDDIQRALAAYEMFSPAGVNYPSGFKEQLCESLRLLRAHSGAELSVTLSVEGECLAITRRTVRA